MSDEIEMLNTRIKHISEIHCFFAGFIAAGGFLDDCSIICSDHLDTLDECWHLLIEKRTELKKVKSNN